MGKKYIIIAIGILIILLGIGMFVFGVSIFCYQGNSLSPLTNTLGKYSFMYFLPTIIIGVLVLVFAPRKKIGVK